MNPKTYLAEKLLAPETHGIVDGKTLFERIVETTKPLALPSIRCKEPLGGLVRLIDVALAHAPLAESPLHGVPHWASVFRNAVVISHEGGYQTGRGRDHVDFLMVALLFSLFHDCRREDEGYDTQHGALGAWALSNVDTGDFMGYIESSVKIATAACYMHTVIDHPRGQHFDFPSASLIRDPVRRDDVAKAIGMCLDADRLDLTRPGLGQRILPGFLSDPDTSMKAWEKLLRAKAWSPEVWFNWKGSKNES